MSELHQPFSEVMKMPVMAAFDLIHAHAKNNERN
jgi:hypothetical protein